jgi:hypothetical protein
MEPDIAAVGFAIVTPNSCRLMIGGFSAAFAQASFVRRWAWAMFLHRTAIRDRLSG